MVRGVGWGDFFLFFSFTSTFSCCSTSFVSFVVAVVVAVFFVLFCWALKLKHESVLKNSKSVLSSNKTKLQILIMRDHILGAKQR